MLLLIWTKLIRFYFRVYCIFFVAYKDFGYVARQPLRPRVNFSPKIQRVPGIAIVEQ